MFEIKNALAENNKQKKQKYIWATTSASLMVTSLINVPRVLQC